MHVICALLLNLCHLMLNKFIQIIPLDLLRAGHHYILFVKRPFSESSSESFASFQLVFWILQPCHASGQNTSTWGRVIHKPAGSTVILLTFFSPIWCIQDAIVIFELLKLSLLVINWSSIQFSIHSGWAIIFHIWKVR